METIKSERLDNPKAINRYKRTYLLGLRDVPEWQARIKEVEEQYPNDYEAKYDVIAKEVMLAAARDAGMDTTKIGFRFALQPVLPDPLYEAPASTTFHTTDAPAMRLGTPLASPTIGPLLDRSNADGSPLSYGQTRARHRRSSSVISNLSISSAVSQESDAASTSSVPSKHAGTSGVLSSKSAQANDGLVVGKTFPDTASILTAVQGISDKKSGFPFKLSVDNAAATYRVTCPLFVKSNAKAKDEGPSWSCGFFVRFDKQKETKDAKGKGKVASSTKLTLRDMCLEHSGVCDPGVNLVQKTGAPSSVYLAKVSAAQKAA